MSASVLHMSMSLDGYIAGPHDEPGNPGGDGFARLHEWYFAGGEVLDEIQIHQIPVLLGAGWPPCGCLGASRMAARRWLCSPCRQSRQGRCP